MCAVSIRQLADSLALCAHLFSRSVFILTTNTINYLNKKNRNALVIIFTYTLFGILVFYMVFLCHSIQNEF